MDLQTMIAAARAYVPSLLGKAGSFSGMANPISAATTLPAWMYPYAKDSNFPGVAEQRAAHPMMHRAPMVPGFSGTLSPNDRVAEAFNQMPQPQPGASNPMQQAMLQPGQPAPPLPPPQNVSTPPLPPAQPQQPQAQLVPGLDQTMLDYYQKQFNQPKQPTVADQFLSLLRPA